MTVRCSVVVAVHNAARYVGAAIASLLEQTWYDLELIVVDDASADGSYRLLQAIADPRLRLLRNDANAGPFAAANRGLDLARGELVARLDADDLAEPDRLAQQIAFLDGQPEVGVCGTGHITIGVDGQPLQRALPAEHDLAIRWHCLLGAPFLHSSVVMRRQLLDSHGLRYDGALTVGGDHELWPRLLDVTRGHNLPAPLVRYRLRPDSISGRCRDTQTEFHHQVAWRTLGRWLGDDVVPRPALVELRQVLAATGAVPAVPAPGPAPDAVARRRARHHLAALRERFRQRLVTTAADRAVADAVFEQTAALLRNPP